MHSIITPNKYPDWVYKELIDLAYLPTRMTVCPEHNIYIDLDHDHKRATLTIPVLVTATDFSDVLEFLGRLSEYENGEEAD